jgi:hypothetical protein
MCWCCGRCCCCCCVGGGGGGAVSAEEEGKGERKRRRGCRRERKGKTTRERRRRIDPKDTFRKVFRYLHDRDQHPVGVEFQRVQELREARDLGLREHGRDRAASGRGHDRRRCGSGGVSRRRRAATALAAPTQRRSIQRQHGSVGFRANRGTMRADWSREPRRGRGRGKNGQPADRPRRRRDNHPLCHRFDGPAGERGRPPTTMPEVRHGCVFFPLAAGSVQSGREEREKVSERRRSCTFSHLFSRSNALLSSFLLAISFGLTLLSTINPPLRLPASIGETGQPAAPTAFYCLSPWPVST